jgi:hypothetical protein
MKRSKTEKSNNQNDDIYVRSLLTQKVVLEYKEVNSTLYDNLETKLKHFNEGKCIKEGYVKNNSLKLKTYSSGELFADKILFETVFECLITNPVESMTIDCVAKSITKVGIRADLHLNDNSSPYIIFIARDHHHHNPLFVKVKENDILNVRVIGQRFELNDKFISVIAELVSINNYKTIKKELSYDLEKEPFEIVDSDLSKDITPTGEKITIKLNKHK